MNQHEIKIASPDQADEHVEGAASTARIRPTYFVDTDYDDFETAMRRARRLRSEAAVAGIELIVRLVAKAVHRVGASLRTGIVRLVQQLRAARAPVDAGTMGNADDPVPDRAA